MIKVEIKDTIQYFENEDAFGKWLIETEQVISIEDFTNREYNAREILQGEYTFDDIKVHWWGTEVYDCIREWFSLGWAEEID